MAFENDVEKNTQSYALFSNFYFWYFAFVGVFFPYFSLYLNWLGFDKLELSILLSIGPLTRIVAPYFWGSLADRMAIHKRILTGLSITSLLIFLMLSDVDDFLMMSIFLVIFSFLMAGILPIGEARTFSALSKKANLYGRIRLWGSVGFILAVIFSGIIFENYSLIFFHTVTVVVLIVLVFSIILIPLKKENINVISHDSIFTVLRHPGVVFAFFSFFLMQVAHGPLNGFFSIFLEELGYSKFSIGLFWGLSVVAEIVLFFFLPKILKRFSIKKILSLSAFLAAFRFFLIGWCSGSALVLCFSQLLHAFTFGAFHAAGIAAVNRAFTYNSAVRGQALYTSLGYGAGGGLGVMLSGLSWSEFGGSWVFTGGAIVALVSFVVIMFVPRVFD